jgi:hypothetical protein
LDLGGSKNHKSGEKKGGGRWLEKRRKEEKMRGKKNCQGWVTSISQLLEAFFLKEIEEEIIIIIIIIITIENGNMHFKESTSTPRIRGQRTIM